MKREDFDHAIRAAAGVIGVDELLVIGSQALHATLSEPLPGEAQRSVEVDVVPFDDADGAIGEASTFHETFGIYVQGVSEETAVLPGGWRDRLIRYESPATTGVVAWCLELHDLVISKAIANRPKDIEFCRAIVRLGAVEPGTLIDRLRTVNGLDDAQRESIEHRIAAWRKP